MLRSTLSHLTLVPERDLGPAELEEGASETLWVRLRREAGEAVAKEPMLAPLLNSVLGQPSFEEAIYHRIAARLGNEILRPSVIADVFRQAGSLDPGIGEAVRADIVAVVDRDPACERFIEPFLYFKGFHAIQAHRVAHWLWINDHRDFALYLQSRSSDVFQTDIHPAALRTGIFSTTRPASSSAPPPSSRTTFRSCRT